VRAIGVTVLLSLCIANLTLGAKCTEPRRVLSGLATIIDMDWQDTRMRSVRDKWPEPLIALADEAVIGTRSCTNTDRRCCTTFGFGVLEGLRSQPENRPLDVVRVAAGFHDEEPARRFADRILEIAIKGWSETRESIARGDRSFRHIEKTIGQTHFLRAVSVTVKQDGKDWLVSARVSELMRDRASR
jgi:hypothetical protein